MFRRKIQLFSLVALNRAMLPRATPCHTRGQIHQQPAKCITDSFTDMLLRLGKCFTKPWSYLTKSNHLDCIYDDQLIKGKSIAYSENINHLYDEFSHRNKNIVVYISNECCDTWQNIINSNLLIFFCIKWSRSRLSRVKKYIKKIYQKMFITYKKI